MQDAPDQYGLTAKNRFIDAVSQYVDDKAVNGFVKEQYVRQWTAGPHGQEMMQNVPELKAAYQSFQSRPTRDTEYEKHTDDLYRAIHTADQPFREQRQQEVFKSTPTEELRQFGDSHKDDFKGDSELERAHRDFETHSRAADASGQNLADRLSKAMGTDVSPDRIHELERTNPELFEKPKIREAHELYDKAITKAEQANQNFISAVSESANPIIKSAVSDHVERALRTAEQTQVTSPPESLQGAPPDHIRSVSEQYKQEINQDNRLAKSHHEFEVAQGASDIARDSLVKHLSKATGEDISSKDIPALQSSKPELFDNPKVKGAMEVYEKAESKAEQSRAEFAQSFDNFRAQHAREPTGHEISQHETERYLNTDWDSARLSIESKLTEYHRLADKGSDEAVRLERAVLEDISKISGDKLNPKIMDEEGARLLVERGRSYLLQLNFYNFEKDMRRTRIQSRRL